MKRDSIRALGIGMALGVALLAACGYRSFSEFAFLAEGDRVLASLGITSSFGSRLTREIASYVAALLAVHVGFGCIAAGIALLLRSAYPRIQVSILLLTCVSFISLAGLILTANSVWFPASIFSFSGPYSLGIAFQRGVSLTLGSLLLVVSVTAAIRVFTRHGHRLRDTYAIPSAAVIAISMVIAGVLTGFKHASAGASLDWESEPRPNIIIVGIDSLRSDIPSSHINGGLVPRIHEFLKGSHVFEDTVSPLARTFPSWVSILTGKHPVTTNARFNLMPRGRVDASETLGFDLKQLGYRTVYATDEVRFANIDRSFGFDRLVTPPVGAADFILGSINDFPLSNVLSRTKVGKWLFPHTYGNRAAHVTYRPEMFDERLADSLDASQPALIAVHLTLAHYPYSWAESPKPTTPNEYRTSYRAAIREVDGQFGRLMDHFESRGLLRNAIVVLLSDHGEALGGEHDTMLRGVGNAGQIWSSVWGHGTSVMSPQQYQVLLAFREYGERRRMSDPGSHDTPASLEDVRPTLLDLVASSLPDNIDGVSLTAVLEGRPAPSAVVERFRFTETDFNTPSVLEGQYDVEGALQEGAAYYEIDRESGWVQLKTARLAELLANKERAALYRGQHLAALPGRDGSNTYLLTDGPNSQPVRLVARPDPEADPRAALLWDALHGRFPGELSGAR